MARKIEEMNLRPKFESLPAAVVNAESDKPVQAREPVEVEAWVPITAGKVRIEARAVEWNKTAVRIEWTDSEGQARSAWVFLGSVKRR
jgi:hypothetical protein